MLVLDKDIEGNTRGVWKKIDVEGRAEMYRKMNMENDVLMTTTKPLQLQLPEEDTIVKKLN